jgi:hypothetical protein
MGRAHEAFDAFKWQEEQLPVREEGRRLHRPCDFVGQDLHNP